MKKRQQRRRLIDSPRTGKGAPIISVSHFGLGCLDRPDVTMIPEECAALSLGWSRAAQAIRAREYGKITVLDADPGVLLRASVVNGFELEAKS